MLNKKIKRSFVVSLVLLAAALGTGSPIPALAARAKIIGVDASQPNQVVIEANGEIGAGAHTMKSDPPRIVIDLKDIGLDQGVKKVITGAGAIEKVETETRSLGQRVRITIYVAPGVDYKVSDQGAKIVVQITGGGGSDVSMPRGDGKPGPEVLPYEATRRELERMMDGQDGRGLDGGPRANVSTWGPVMPTGPEGTASTVCDVYFRSIFNGIQIMIETNGIVGEFVDYELKRPNRLVVEIPCIDYCVNDKVFPFHYMGIGKVRLTRDDGCAKVIVDFRPKFTAYDVKRTTSGIVVSVLDAKYVPGGVDYKIYTTGVGEDLREISRRFYGDPNAWRRILSANRKTFITDEVGCMDNSCGTLILGKALDLRIPVR